MKMKHFFSAVLVLAAQISLLAQEITIHNGAQFQVTSAEFVETVVDANDQGTSFFDKSRIYR